jgi:hypothetical protein
VAIHSKAAAALSATEVRHLAGCMLLLDSTEEGEAAAAFARVRSLLRRHEVRLCESLENPQVREALRNALGHPAWLASSQEAAKLREENERLDRQCSKLADAITRLKEAGADCWPCEVKRRWLAAIGGVVFISLWLLATGHARMNGRHRFYGATAGALPFFLVWCHWKLRYLTRDLEWRSLTDNRIAHTVFGRRT